MSSRKHNSRNAFRSAIRLESLEHRHPLAGNVTAALAGSTLRLTGDDRANDVIVASAAGGRIAVIGIDTTINGKTPVFVTNQPVTSIIANFGGGNDSAGFGNSAADYAGQRLFTMMASSPETLWSDDAEPADPFDVAALQSKIDRVSGGIKTFSIPGNLTVSSGSGDDSIGISGDIGGSVAADLGSADTGNGLFIGVESSPSRIRGAVNVAGGRQNDLVAIGNVAVEGRVMAALGEGTNWMCILGGPTAETTVGSFIYTGGSGSDSVGTLGDVVVQNDVRISTGPAGEDSVSFFKFDDGGSVLVRGNAVINTGPGNDDDNVCLIGEVRGDMSVTTGGGKDTVSISSLVGSFTHDGGAPVPTFDVAGPASVGRDLTISTGAGNDVVAIGASFIGRNAWIDAGAGNDLIKIESMKVRRNLAIRLGAGDDSLEIANLNALATSLDGGRGTNSLTMDSVTQAANRGLKFERFQTVDKSPQRGPFVFQPESL